mmetsp:Transcript_128213/g.356817  ORF Transcript_128213/g.356817 Transcript_128213/m.356817 type:complete len:248 (+) Transcript_128213:81-824(+)
MLLVVLARLTHHHSRDLPEVWQLEATERVHPLLLYEVALHLHHNEVTLLHGSRHLQDLLHTAIVQVRDPEVHVWLIQRGFVRVGLGPPQATPHSPVDNRPLAQLGVPRVPLEEPIQPLEGAFIRQHHREHDLVLPIFGHCVGSHHHIIHCSILHHAAGKGQWHVWVGSEVHVQRDVLEGNSRVEDLSLQGLRQGLRFARAFPILEQRYGAGIWARLIVEVEDHSDDVLGRKLLRDRAALPVEEHIAF